jgi:hypothetical protein
MRALLLLFVLCLTSDVKAQLLTWSPDFIRDTGTSAIEIIADARRGNKGLQGYSNLTDVYVHIGVITSLSSSQTDWKYVKFSSFSTPNAPARCTSLGDDRWKFDIPGGLRTFFNITNAGERILRIAILLRNGAGTQVLRNADGSDMYIPVYDNGYAVRIERPFRQPLYLPKPETLNPKIGDSIDLQVKASMQGRLQLSLNGVALTPSTPNTQTLSVKAGINTSGLQTVVASGDNGTITLRDTLTFFVASAAPEGPVPAGLRNGINYEPGDTAVTLVLFAPGKSSVHVIGDFNDWTQRTEFQMTKAPDGRHWLRIRGLTPGTEYGYQYLVDGSIKVADYMTEKVLDPWNDPFIPSSTYPGLKPYPTGKTTGIVSVLQTAKPAYTWKTAAFSRPDKRNLVIYELLLRDFLGAPNWRTLTDTLSYLKRLGVNVIQLMPVNEFEGNNSWGYNPAFYFAPDKYYGTENEFRRFVDSCHASGMAVVLDIALNHSFGSSPMVQMYWDAAAGKPATDNPWFNQDAKHPFNVGYDFNHESQATKDFTDRVIEHWLTNYRIDGFRWDLSKGFTQVNNPTNVGAWGAYDASRVAIWKRINDKMQSVSAGSYCILEHFAANTEEIELANQGMLLWGNMNHNFNEAAMGFVSSSNFEGSLASARGWNQPHLIAYQESHDEERLMYKNLTFGNNTSTSHNVRSLPVALERNAMTTAFWAMMPGPKMLWQFGELGYDFSITFCPGSNSVPQPYPDMQCRTDMKPVRWDYRNDPARYKLYQVYAALLALRKDPRFLPTFTTNTGVEHRLAGAYKTLKVWSDSLRVVVIGNFGVVPTGDTVRFPKAGTWYDYLNRTTIAATGLPQTISLMPGEYKVFIDREVGHALVTSDDMPVMLEAGSNLQVFPNPASDKLQIEYELSASGPVRLNLITMDGRLVSTMFSGMRARGKHVFQASLTGLGAGHLPAGRYLVVLESGGMRRQTSLVITR